MTNTNETLERQVIGLIAADRLDIPISSLSGKLKRMKPKLAGRIELAKGSYNGTRVYARVEAKDILKARTISEAVDDFCTEHPQYGAVLQQMIEDKRSVSETHLYFGIQQGCRLTAEDYLGVMADLGFTEAQASSLYGPLMDTSRNIARKRAEGERRILIG